jgi:hypothetical protein
LRASFCKFFSEESLELRIVGFAVCFLEARIRFLTVRDSKAIFIEDLFGKVKLASATLNLGSAEVAGVGASGA